MELPIRSVEIREYPQAGRFSTTKYQASINFSDGRKGENAYGSTINNLRKNLELKYGRLMTKTFFPIIYRNESILLLRSDDDSRRD